MHKAKRRALKLRNGGGGRPRGDGVREGNGRLSRRTIHVAERAEMTEAEAMSVGVEARMRRTGLPRELAERNRAGEPNAGTMHGVLALEGTINGDQWKAAELYLGCRTAWLRAIDAPGRPNEPIEPGRNGETDEEAFARWCQLARQRWRDLLDCVQDASTEARMPIKAALDVILVRGNRMFHLEAALRRGLDAIHRRFMRG